MLCILYNFSYFLSELKRKFNGIICLKKATFSKQNSNGQGSDGCGKTLFSRIISAIERVELFARREDISREASEEVMLILDKLCEDYEKLYWNPDNFTQT